MACGLEVRAPFLDAELVDFMQGLPPSFKLGRNQTKRLLKRAVKGGCRHRSWLDPRRVSASRSRAGSRAAGAAHG